MKTFVKIFGKKKKEDNLFIEVTTWDGMDKVIVITPKNPTNKQKQDTIDFILHELDDHDGYNDYLNKISGI